LGEAFPWTRLAALHLVLAGLGAVVRSGEEGRSSPTSTPPTPSRM
jgi:hypothetical protein